MSVVSEGKLHSVIPSDGSGDWTVDRNCEASFIDKDRVMKFAPPNTPRIDWSTGEPMLLVERESRNLIPWSEKISMWAFTIGISVIDDYDFAPNGKKTASKIIFSSSRQQKAIPITASTGDHSAFVWIKGVANETIQIRLLSDISLYTLTGEWQKIELRGLNTSDARISIGTYMNATAREVVIWGVQAEKGEPTSYIPTNGSIVTRLADKIYKDNAQDLIGQSEGVIYLEGDFHHNDSRINISDGTQDNRVEFSFRSENTCHFIVSSGGTNVIFELGFSSIHYKKVKKVAIKYKSGDSKIFINGELLYSSTAALPGFVNSLDTVGLINSTKSTSHVLRSRIMDFRLHKTVPSDDQLIALTTP